ncbi:MAG TPA: TonB-dependent receptor, partial [Moraxellaceae bacterium]|nr:TonB-dependent receptor [Moraxellaceae bacterium]
VTLGNNAIGGGVAFTTVDAQDLLLPDQKMGAKVKLGYASNDQQFQRSLTTYAKPNDQLDMIVSYSERDSDGGEDGKSNHIQGDDITIKSILAKVNVMPAEGHKITASYQSY